MVHAHYPSFIKYDGPILELFEQPQLPSDFADLDPAAKKAAQKLRTAQTLWGLYQAYTQKEAPGLLSALCCRNALAAQIICLAGSVFDDGEIYVQYHLSELARPENWGQISSDVPCPLNYSEDELAKQRDELAKWERDIELKAQAIAQVGARASWDGAVRPEEFDIVSQRLQEVKERFLEYVSETGSEEERRQWETAWPFRDSD